MSRIEQQMEFMREIDGLKKVERQTYLKDASRKENDAEHSWHLAMMALLMQEYANETIDLLHVISMVLIHDIVELDAGDTYAYDTEGNATKRERELAAAERNFSILPEDQAKYFRSLWDEFEEEETAEARFAHVLDNIQPMILNDASDGKAWKEHQVKLSQILQRNQNTAKGSKAVWKYAREQILEKHIAEGNILLDVPDEKTESVFC